MVHEGPSPPTGRRSGQVLRSPQAGGQGLLSAALTLQQSRVQKCSDGSFQLIPLEQNSHEWLNYPDYFLIYGFLAPRISEAPNSHGDPERNHLGNLGFLLGYFMSGGLSTQREAEAEGIDSYRCSQKQKSKLS